MKANCPKCGLDAEHENESLATCATCGHVFETQVRRGIYNTGFRKKEKPPSVLVGFGVGLLQVILAMLAIVTLITLFATGAIGPIIGLSLVVLFVFTCLAVLKHVYRKR